MATATTLDRTAAELRAEVSPWKRSHLYRIGLAMQAAGAGDSDDAAQNLIWDVAEQLDDGYTVREILELQGVDVAAVERELSWLEHDARETHRETEREQLRAIGSGLPTARIV